LHLRRLVEVAFAKIFVLALCCSVHAAPARPEDLAKGCSDVSSLRSTTYHQVISLNFLNKTKASINIIWIDYEGLRKPYKALGPNQNFNQSTYVSHSWLVTDPSGKCLGAFVASESQEVIVNQPATVKGPEDAAPD
jgi:von Hippel-Lindau disease tumor suppressor protein